MNLWPISKYQFAVSAGSPYGHVQEEKQNTQTILPGFLPEFSNWGGGGGGSAGEQEPSGVGPTPG